MVPITIVDGVYKPAYNWGAPPCRKMDMGKKMGKTWENHGRMIL